MLTWLQLLRLDILGESTAGKQTVVMGVPCTVQLGVLKISPVLGNLVGSNVTRVGTLIQYLLN
jgi:hypothetical protein